MGIALSFFSKYLLNLLILLLLLLLIAWEKHMRIHITISKHSENYTNGFSIVYNRIVKPNGSICWQIGYHVSEKLIIPLDYIIYDIWLKMIYFVKLDIMQGTH